MTLPYQSYIDHIPTPDCLTGNCPTCNFAAGIGRREAVHGELMTGDEPDIASLIAVFVAGEPADHERRMLLQNIANDLGLTITIHGKAA